MVTDLPVHDHTDYGIKLVEEERRRVARDLHDGPAQALTNVSMKLEIIQQLFQSNPDMALQELGRLNRRVVSVINDVRRLIYDLRPVAIDEVGLIPASAELARRCEREWQIPVRCTIEEGTVPDLSPAKQVALYRLVQEVLSNVGKHAQAKCCVVEFSAQAADLVIRVQDDGVGFDPAQVPVGHYGIIGMKERASYLGGTLRIESSPSVGSVVTIIIPNGARPKDAEDPHA